MIFRKPKVEEPQTPAATDEPQQQVAHPQDQPAAPPPTVEEATTSVLTSDVVMEGNLVTSGELHLNGTVHGAVQATRVVIDVDGAVNGQVVAEEIVIRGRVIGPICGVRVHLLPGAQVEGDVMNQSIVVEDGAFIDGQIRHSDDPLGEWQQMWYGDDDAVAAVEEPQEASEGDAAHAQDAEPEAPYLQRTLTEEEKDANEKGKSSSGNGSS